jgi:hypothetical protein
MDVQKTIEFLLQNQAKHDAQIGRLINLQNRNEKMLAHVVESIDGLARIAHAHEQRITGLEGGPA